MMTRLKMDLEKDLNDSSFSLIASEEASNISTNNSETRQHINGLKIQIKHIDEQMRCVQFLLMQCQIGLENCCQDNNNKMDRSLSFTSTSTTTTSATIPPITINQIEVSNKAP